MAIEDRPCGCRVGPKRRWFCQYHEGYADGVDILTANIEAFIKFTYPDDMTPAAKRMLESILERHATVP